MRVLHVLLGLHAAGIERLAEQLITHAPAGHQHELLNLDPAERTLEPAFAALEASGRLQARHELPPRDGPALAWRTWRLCRRHRIEAVLIYPFQRPLLWLALGARLAGVRRLAVHLGNAAPADRRGRRAWRRLLQLFCLLGVRPVPCSEAIAASLQPLPAGVSLGPVIANGCDTAAIAATAAAARAARPAGDPRRIVMVGRLEALKDPATLLRAFAAAGPPPGWQLQVVGEGPERPRLEALARSLGLDPATVLPGRHPAIAELLAQADLFAFSTTAAEGFGIALIEAMAAGLPVLASDVPACREVLHGGSAGLLVPAGDVAAWAEALRQLCGNADRRGREAAAALDAARQYDSRAMASHWLELLKRC